MPSNRITAAILKTPVNGVGSATMVVTLCRWPERAQQAQVYEYGK